MKKSKILLIALLACVSVSCEREYLTPWPPDAARTTEDVWNYYKFSKGVLDAIYADHICCPYVNDISGYGMLASACDEAEHSVSTSVVQNFTNGVWNPSRVPTILYGAPWATRYYRTPWNNSYQGIRKVNLFLEGVNSSPVLIDNLEDPAKRYERTWFKGQAYFWRALLQFQLLRTYGEFVISTKVENVDDPQLFRPKNTIDECVAQILKDCDSAIDSLPVMWSNDEFHRANKTAAQALKARTLLYYASPLYQGDVNTFGSAKNTVGDVNRWKAAADAAREAINGNAFYELEKVTRFTRPYSAKGTYNDVVHFRMELKNKEFIFGTPPTQNSSAQNEYYNLPAGVDGFYGYTNPTQEMVDAFEVVKYDANGDVIGSEPFDWNNPEHALNPYENRDPRFYASILFNDYFWGDSPVKGYKIETYEGGKHRDKNLKNSTKTGYYYRKFLSEGFYKYLSGYYTLVQRGRHEFRFSELILNYAEAMNEAYGPKGVDPNGELRIDGINTAEGAINAIRARVNMPALTAAATASKESMREAIKHERRIELCFEGHRFYDVRRWKEGDTFGKPIHGIVIEVAERDAEGNPTKFTYKVEKVEDRVWEDKMYWWPIPYEEIAKYNGKLKQNPGWE